jgi:predicted DNA-binding transcriptional regulator AlpA
MDYAVTITHQIADIPVDLERLLDNLPPDAAVSLSHTELSVSLAVEADDITGAIHAATLTVNDASKLAGIGLEDLLEVQVSTWERFEQQIATPTFPDVVSAPEVGTILGVSRQRVHKMLSDDRLPPPIIRLGSGPLWLRSTIEAFDRSWTRKVGRPLATRLGPDPDNMPVHLRRLAPDPDNPPAHLRAFRP